MFYSSMFYSSMFYVLCSMVLQFYSSAVLLFYGSTVLCSTVCIKKRLAFEIPISHNVLNLPDKYNCLESFSES